jgi:hypothetical protein
MVAARVVAFAEAVVAASREQAEKRARGSGPAQQPS